MEILALVLSVFPGLAVGHVGCLPRGEVIDLKLPSITLSQLTSPGRGNNVTSTTHEDRITATIEPLPAGSQQVEIRLVAAGNVTWWKGVEIRLGTERGKDCFVGSGEPGSRIDLAWTRDEDSSSTVTLRPELAESCTLVFWKAKAFGVETAMYQLSGNLAGLKGQRLTIYWEADHP